MLHLSTQLEPTVSTKILVGSSDPVLLKVLRQFLPDQHELIEVHSSHEVLHAAQEASVALIVLDLETLGLDGSLASRIIRNRSKTRHIPLIVLYLGEHQLVHTIDNCEGCIDYIAKPCKPEVLLWKVQGFLNFRCYLNQIKQEPRHDHLTTPQCQIPQDKDSVCGPLEQFIQFNSCNLSNQLAACVAHEIKNPMTTMHALLDLARLTRSPLDHDKIEILISELDRINTILSNYLTINKGKRSERAEYHLEEIVEDMRYLLDAKGTREHKNIVYNLKACPPVYVNYNDITQLLLNLALNGLEAMDEAGTTLTITTRYEAHNVELVVRDQGPGIPREALNRIWEPFFTTKSGGSGLGLAICRSLAKRNNASLAVETSPRGTAFIISFVPVSAKKLVLD